MEEYKTIGGIKYKPVKIEDIRKKISFTSAARGCGFCSFTIYPSKICILKVELRPCNEAFQYVFMNKTKYIKVFKHKFNPYK